MAKVTRGRKVDTWKTKKWYKILAPPQFDYKPVGETIASDPSLVIGRTIETTLGDIDGDMSKQHIKLKFKVIDVAGENANTEFIGHDMTRDYIRSLIRRRTSKVDVNVLVSTKDGRVLRVKASAFTIKRANTSQIKAIRKIMEDIILKRSKELTFDDFIYEILSGKLSSLLYREAKVVYPLRRVEVRRTEIKSVKVEA
jgi:small subunit ribosomal protein S3Ae